MYNILDPLIYLTERLTKIDKNILLQTFSIVKYCYTKIQYVLHYFIGFIICSDVHKRLFLIITVAADQINILYDSHYNLHSSEARLLCVYTRKCIMTLLFKAHT